MAPSPEYYINKFLCEQCKFFQDYKLDYHVVDDEGEIRAKELPNPFGKCVFYDKSIEGREHSCNKFKKENDLT
jgi:hypothetical protein